MDFASPHVLERYLSQMEERLDRKVEERLARRLEQVHLKTGAGVRSEQSAEEEPEWVPLQHSRRAGDIIVPDYLTDLFKADSMETVFTKQSIARYLERHPEPQGGHLMAQVIDSELHVSSDVRKRDEPWFETQRAVLCAVRPLISLAEKINSMEEEGDPERLTSDIRKIIRYLLHVAGTIRVHRRRATAASIDFIPGSDSHGRLGSSEDGQLFGPELREAIKMEKKSMRPKGRPSTGERTWGPGGGGQPKRKIRWSRTFSNPKRNAERSPLPPQERPHRHSQESR